MSAPWCLTGWACAPSHGSTSTAPCGKPDFAEAYNFIGVYLVQQQNYDKAYEGVRLGAGAGPGLRLRLSEPGIALYYGNRPGGWPRPT